MTRSEGSEKCMSTEQNGSDQIQRTGVHRQSWWHCRLCHVQQYKAPGLNCDILVRYVRTKGPVGLDFCTFFEVYDETSE